LNDAENCRNHSSEETKNRELDTSHWLFVAVLSCM
jgi:hypothetical protein